LPALANEDGKGRTLAAIPFASHWPVGETPTLLDPPLARHLGNPLHALRRGAENAAKSNGVGGHGPLFFRGL
jgi:hypothetical protein